MRTMMRATRPAARIALACGLVLGMAACQSESADTTAGAGAGGGTTPNPILGPDTDPIVAGDAGPGGCPAGSLARTVPTSGATACFYGGGCPDGEVPVRIDSPGGSTVSCGRLEVAECTTGWMVGDGLVEGASLCLPQPPCTEPANLSQQQADGGWELALDCSAGVATR